MLAAIRRTSRTAMKRHQRLPTLFTHVPSIRVLAGLWTGAWLGYLTSTGAESPTPPLPTGMALQPLPRQVPEPADNPGSPEKIRLGRDLFFDPILSESRTVACATCHHPKYAWADGRRVPLGVGGIGLGPDRHLAANATQIPVLRRNTPSLLNAGLTGYVQAETFAPEHAPMFWDSRIAGLEAQVAVPLGTIGEMCVEGCLPSIAIAKAVEQLRQIPEYTRRFSTAFPEASVQPITPMRLSQAIAAFERTLVSPPAPVDRFLAGETIALTPLQQQGLRIFTKDGCIQCHGGPMFSDFKLHVVGVANSGPDGGRAFRTPSLRNLAFSAPYMHNGSLATLRDVLVFYDELGEAVSETLDGGAPASGPTLDPLLRHLRVEPDQFPALEAFLEALNSPLPAVESPQKTPSGLPVAGLQ